MYRHWCLEGILRSVPVRHDRALAPPGRVAGALRGAGEPEAVSPAFEEFRVRWELDVDAREGGDES